MANIGRLELRTLRLYRIVKYWFKILSMPERKYVSIMYNTMINDLEVNPNKNNWASLLRDLLSQMGFNHVWAAQGVGNMNAFLDIFKQRIKDIELQGWRGRSTASGRARFYSSISNFGPSVYLKVVNIAKYWEALTRLRVSSHRLFVEVGRWNNTPLDDRKCNYCLKLEDEFHFIFECTLYEKNISISIQI